MKEHDLCEKLSTVLQMAYKHACQHALSIDAMKGIYYRKLPHQDPNKTYLSVGLGISPQGSIYKVTQQIYIDGDVVEESSWLATYGWHSNGHLIEIGGERCCILDPLQKTLYLENYNDANVKTLEIYTQIERP